MKQEKLKRLAEEAGGNEADTDNANIVIKKYWRGTMARFKV